MSGGTAVNTLAYKPEDGVSALSRQPPNSHDFPNSKTTRSPRKSDVGLDEAGQVRKSWSPMNGVCTPSPAGRASIHAHQNGDDVEENCVRSVDLGTPPTSGGGISMFPDGRQHQSPHVNPGSRWGRMNSGGMAPDMEYGSDTNVRSSGPVSWPSDPGNGRVPSEASSPKKSSSLSMGNLLAFKRNRSNSPPEEGGDKIKDKLMSAWNNMRHGWTVKVKTNFRIDTAIWVLGKFYHNTQEDMANHRPSKGLYPSIEKFKEDFTSRIWFTYRKDFAALPGSSLQSDVGWGCMLRSGQMLLAQALVSHLLGRDWRWFPEQTQQENHFHRQVIRFFGDALRDECPFSIHHLVNIGYTTGKVPGDWYGPASVAYVLKEAMDPAPRLNPELKGICLYVAQDCTVYEQDVIDLCTFSAENGQSPRLERSLEDPYDTQEDPWKSVIILIPVRIGGENLNPIYIPCIQSILANDMCIGIIGGKPKHSVYFVGWQDDKLVYMDPHFCQDSFNVVQKDFPLHSYHCMSPRKMAFTKMDPSCTIGFYCKTRKDFETFALKVHEISTPPKERESYPMFTVATGRSSDVNYEAAGKERVLRVRRYDRSGNLRQASKDSEDFVFL